MLKLQIWRRKKAEKSATNDQMITPWLQAVLTKIMRGCCMAVQLWWRRTATGASFVSRVAQVDSRRLTHCRRVKCWCQFWSGWCWFYRVTSWLPSSTETYFHDFVFVYRLMFHNKYQSCKYENHSREICYRWSYWWCFCLCLWLVLWMLVLLGLTEVVWNPNLYVTLPQNCFHANHITSYSQSLFYELKRFMINLTTSNVFRFGFCHTVAPLCGRKYDYEGNGWGRGENL